MLVTQVPLLVRTQLEEPLTDHRVWQTAMGSNARKVSREANIIVVGKKNGGEHQSVCSPKHILGRSHVHIPFIWAKATGPILHMWSKYASEFFDPKSRPELGHALPIHRSDLS